MTMLAVKPSVASRYSGLAFGCVLIALLWSAVLQQESRVDKLREDGYRLELLNYARLMEAHTRSVILGLDQVVMHLKAEYEDDPVHFQFQALIDRSPILKGLSVQVGIVGADGIVIFSTAPVTGPDGKPIRLSDREHFRVHQDVDSGNLFVSKPVLGRASGKWSIQLTRRINDRKGGFAGMVVVSLSPDYLSDIYKKIELGHDSRILLVGMDGVVRAQASGQDRSVGQSFTKSLYFPETLKQPEGYIAGVSPVDGSDRVAAFRQLPDYPLMVIVSRPAASLQALHATDHRLFMVAGWGGSLLIVIGILVLQWQVLQQHASERQLRCRESELDTARAALEHKNRDLAQFTEVLAHHLQEPVRLQHAFSQRLAKLLPIPLSPEAGQALQFVMDGATRQRALLRDVQLYLSVAQLPPATTPCSPDNTLDVVLDRLDGKLVAAGAVVQRGNLPRVMIDKGRLTDVFQILIDNAVDYLRTNVTPVIRVAGERRGNVVELWVSDNGIGIPDEFHTRVFRVFERLNPRRGDPGTGIGLALAKKVIESAGGRIWIENAGDGPGTSVHFTLAASEDKDDI